MNFKNASTYVKENYSLSRERVTVMTIIDEEENTLPSHFVFKGAGTLDGQLVKPEGCVTLWAPKGSYRLDQLLKTIEALPDKTRRQFFGRGLYDDYKICLLDDYTVHVMPEVNILCDFFQNFYHS